MRSWLRGSCEIRPQTKGTADHSRPVCLAIALIDGDVTEAQFERDRWRAQDMLALLVAASREVSDPHCSPAQLRHQFREATVRARCTASLRHLKHVPQRLAADTFKAIELDLSSDTLGKIIFPIVLSPLGGKRVAPEIQGIDLRDWNTDGQEYLRRCSKKLESESF
jgi:hypothetical protein